jgi:hypothetical protein
VPAVVHRRESRERRKRGGKEGGNSWRSWAAPGGLLVGQGKQEMVLDDVQGNSMQLLPVSPKKTKPLCTSPMAFRVF